MLSRCLLDRRLLLASLPTAALLADLRCGLHLCLTYRGLLDLRLLDLVLACGCLLDRGRLLALLPTATATFAAAAATFTATTAALFATHLRTATAIAATAIFLGCDRD